MTAPRFAWVLNLGAELELTRPGYNPAAKVLAQLEQYGGGARALLGPDDVLVKDKTPVGPGFIGRAWSPTPQARALLRAAGVTPEPFPEPDVIRRVNHRRFACELGGGLPEQRYIESRDALDVLLRSAEYPWLLKRPLGFAGRGQLRVYARDKITEKEWQWIDASLREEGVLAEPLVVLALETSQHGFVFTDGHWELGRPCVQGVTDRGVFRQIRLAEPGELTDGELRALGSACERVAAALRDAGYIGPYGIDAYRYRHRGNEGFCALSEINARYTMGFVTGFPRHPSTVRISEPGP